MITTKQRVGADTCTRCRKKFAEGDRITPVYIVEKAGINPDNILESGAFLSPDFELAHLFCEDPGLIKGVRQ